MCSHVLFLYRVKTAYVQRISDWSSDVCSSDLHVVQVDILPDVEFGPVRDREHPHALALGLFRIVELPQLGPLVLRVPAVIGRTERKHPFLRPAPRSAERREGQE